MNILFLANHLNTGGITSYLLTLSAGLEKRGHRVFIASSGGDRENDFLGQGAVLLKVPLRTKSEASPGVIFSLFRILPVLKKEKIDLIHANTRVTQALAFWLYKFSRVPYVSTCHGFFRPSLHRKLFPFWGKKVIAISDSVSEHLIKDFKIDPEKVKLIYNGIDVEKFREQARDSVEAAKKNLGLKAGPVVGIIARLSEVKGHIYLIQAFKEVLRSRPDAQLFIVGEGKTHKELVDAVATLGMLESVKFVPRIDDTRKALMAMDIFVMPSLAEGLGLALMEAMASGLAAVASDIGGLRNLISDHQNGILVKPEDPAGLARAILELLNDAAKRKSYADRARKFILENFSQDKMVTETLNLYQACLGVS
ncbi:MAG: glycosyltransferase family 4 protein [Candidatus Omnitrophica bacterium]|nr:glycosyltransferase family 4 protein [Candidatus Omnitrophota bacterium]MDD5237031.1 glycosyltransferase family 4 protein [Candidatus Omnitrophota bacterium]MDD5610931.1 glycosyltransferase family 4 protein [Candidatus Omnitrophota bacterium]